MQNMLVMETIWKMSLQAGLMIPIVLLCSFLLRRQSKKYSYALWMLVILRLLVPVFMESPVTVNGIAAEKLQQLGQNIFAGQKALSLEKRLDKLQINGNKNANETEVAEKGSELRKQSEDDGFTAAKQSENNEFILAGQSKKEDNVLWQYDFGNIKRFFAYVWLAGVMVAALYFFLQFMRVKRQIALAVHRDENVWLCDRIPTPFVMGVVRPRIYIPFHLDEQDEYCILEHEKMHIRHGDHLVRLLGMLAVCLHWWNPLVWVAVNRLNQDMEMYCDETVVEGKSIVKKKQYMTVLLHFAVEPQRYMGVVAFGESHTEKRVMHLLIKRRTDRNVTALVTAVAVILCICAFTVQGKADGISNAVQKDWQQGTDESGTEVPGDSLKESNTEKAFSEDWILENNDSMEEIWDITAEQAAEWLKEFINVIKTDDRQWVAQHFEYPCVLSVDGREVRLDDASNLLLHYDDIFTEKFVGQIPHWADDGLWANWQGIALGNGNIWFEVKNEEWIIRALMDEENGLEVRPVTSSKQ